jgi:hypothetical protein
MPSYFLASPKLNFYFLLGIYVAFLDYRSYIRLLKWKFLYYQGISDEFKKMVTAQVYGSSRERLK